MYSQPEEARLNVSEVGWNEARWLNSTIRPFNVIPAVDPNTLPRRANDAATVTDPWSKHFGGDSTAANVNGAENLKLTQTVDTIGNSIHGRADKTNVGSTKEKLNGFCKNREKLNADAHLTFVYPVSDPKSRTPQNSPSESESESTQNNRQVNDNYTQNNRQVNDYPAIKISPPQKTESRRKTKNTKRKSNNPFEYSSGEEQERILVPAITISSPTATPLDKKLINNLTNDDTTHYVSWLDTPKQSESQSNTAPSQQLSGQRLNWEDVDINVDEVLADSWISSFDEKTQSDVKGMKRESFFLIYSFLIYFKILESFSFISD